MRKNRLQAGALLLSYNGIRCSRIDIIKALIINRYMISGGKAKLADADGSMIGWLEPGARTLPK